MCALEATLYEREEVLLSGGSWQTPHFDWKPALSTLTATDGGETDAFEIAAMATLYECEEVSSSGGSWQTPLFDWKPALSTLARLLLGLI
eukprot:CAMPEP_0185841974 /NCGR_PEP_ID=MMETSP1353-20130828/18170_1 /TAXON_ID=1077150 /ORGANISM="Erythrolobus australicus, Strain CCMP3124" /LENGTH=89 /DNA_ID=CAMNT_0028541467 /DNA_START=533 /DNA_END=803 /DNA_ORIENTATION=-